jgi:hypothetical protein
MISFTSASAIEELAPGRFRASVPDGWQQGRGAFGGLVLGMLLRAIERTAVSADRRSVRTLQGDLVGPVVPGPVEIRAELLRSGANQSNLRAELVQEGERVALASAVLSSPRVTALPGLLPSASPMPFEQAATVHMDAPGAPVFTQHFEYRTTGAAPWTGAPAPVVEGWVRPRVANPVVDAPLLIALLDAFWPAYFMTARAFRPIVTIAFAAQVTCEPEQPDPAAPLFYRARTVSDYAGFQLELRELFDARGAIVAMNQQTFAVLK